jgi:anti-anti-sigma factor
MLEDELNVTSEIRDESIAVINLTGDVTSFAEEKIKQAYAVVTSKGATKILLNFHQNDYINSAGIAILISIVTDVTRNNQRLAVSGLSQHFQKIFRMVGLAQYIDIYQDEEEALLALMA